MGREADLKDSGVPRGLGRREGGGMEEWKGEEEEEKKRGKGLGEGEKEAIRDLGIEERTTYNV